MDGSTPDRTLLSGDITRTVIAAFYQTYNELGPGFPEFVARRALAITVRGLGLDVLEEAVFPVRFRDHEIGKFRVDLLVSRSVVVEVKVSPEIERFHLAQVLHYLKAAELDVGLLLNFGRTPQFKRIIYDSARRRPRYDPPAEAPG